MSKIKSTILGATVGLIALIICILATSSILSTQMRSAQTEAKVVGSGSLCTQVSKTLDNNEVKVYPECFTHIQYEVNGKMYLTKINTKTEKFESGNKIIINYNPSNPEDISYNEVSLQKIGMYLFLISIFLVLIIMGYNYITTHYKKSIEGYINKVIK